MLLVYTARPEFRAPWPLRSHHAQLTLSRLNRSHVRAMVRQVVAETALGDDVVEAVRSGQFHIWTAQDVDGVLQLLTGLPCGEPDTAGIYPESSLHRLVWDRLEQFGRTLRATSGAEEKRAEERSK